MPSLQQSREAVAHQEAGRTDIRPAGALALLVMFALLTAALPLWQLAAQWREARASGSPFRPTVLELFRSAPDLREPFRERGWGMPAMVAANRMLLKHMRAFEDTLDDQLPGAAYVRPAVQWLLSGLPGVGNEQAYIGRDGWLFYRPDLDYLTGPGFLDPRQLARRVDSAPEWQRLPQPDPRPAILDMHRQLAERGIRLIVMPVPVKPGIHPETFAPWPEKTSGAVLQNRSYARWRRVLLDAGVELYEPGDRLMRLKRESGRPVYLATDTHWTPDAMEAVARELAGRVSPASARIAPPDDRRRPLPWRTTGDITRMLNLPAAQTRFPDEAVTLMPVLDADDGRWRASPDAQILVLGDSFCNIYSLEGMGWGASAGLVEQLAFSLGAPVDRMVRNDGGAHATREMLRREQAAGRDRLSGKRVVIWQFAVRELASGDWPVISLEQGAPPPDAFFVPPPGTSCVVTATVRQRSSVPRPGSVPYADHLMAMHLVDLPGDAQAVVYIRSMIQHQWTPAARVRNGDAITVRLRAWSEVAAQWDGMNRSELDDLDLQLQEPCWGEWLDEPPVDGTVKN